jgi:hypothetical protein
LIDNDLDLAARFSYLRQLRYVTRLVRDMAQPNVAGV